MKVLAHIQAFLKDEEGASGIEYALVAAMVAVVIASFATPVKTAVGTVWTNIVNGLK
ncbi:MAG: Flp family type IVb pilin [Aquabacterium sp.]